MLTHFKMEKITPLNYLTFLSGSTPEINEKNKEFLGKLDEDGFDIYYVSGRYKGRLAYTFAAVNREAYENSEWTVEHMENFYKNNLEKWCEENFDELETIN